MKVGYPDTINSSAAAASPVKARYASSGEGEDLKAVEIKKGSLAKKEDPPTNYSDTPINMITPIKAVSPARAKLIADNKAAAEKAKKAEAAIRQSQSSSETTTEPTRKKNKIGRAIQARKERRAENNPKVKARQEGRAERKELNKKIKTEKARVTTASKKEKLVKLLID